MIEKDVSYSRLDVALASMLAKRSGLADKAERDRLYSLVQNVSAALASGHSCIEISEEERAFLLPLNCVSEDEKTPLIVEDNRLYFYRYWHYETRLAQQIALRIHGLATSADDLQNIVNHYFAEDSEDDIDWQRRAAINVAQQRFSIITGGPGTGKTTTVLKVLAILQTLHGYDLSIGMAAPTGKAAMRLQESLAGGENKTDNDGNEVFSEQVKQSIPQDVSTIHRLLGAKRNSVYFKHHADNPLIHDVVVIDEASMVDLSLMSKLIDALKPSAQLILLGDKDQLSSVESGAVLADLSQALPEHTSELKKSYRFLEDIKNFATAINQQDTQRAWELLEGDECAAVRRVQGDLLEHLHQEYAPYLQAVRSSHDPAEIFAQFNRFKVLCAMRRGKLGIENLNASFERRLQHQEGFNIRTGWYAGKPVMITQNDPATGLFNGDIGICLYPPEERTLTVFFEQQDGSMKRILPMRLPQYETAFAMTIHKSQGSEFATVLMVLPDQMNPLLSKELLYTAVTRAKENVQVAAQKEIFQQALEQRVERTSGLSQKLVVNSQ